MLAFTFLFLASGEVKASKVEDENIKKEESVIYVTGTMNDDGEIIFKEHKELFSDRSATVTIAVYVGKILVGYLTATIIDGVVKSATGKTGAEWVEAAIKKVVGRKYNDGMTVTLPCSIYPPNSQIGAQCRG
ncbi:MAG: hypothetical protein Q4B52_07785 [Tissierellia bacterium]|nr:hypothetical protein [Tissierellia bacterium]